MIINQYDNEKDSKKKFIMIIINNLYIKINVNF